MDIISTSGEKRGIILLFNLGQTDGSCGGRSNFSLILFRWFECYLSLECLILEGVFCGDELGGGILLQWQVDLASEFPGGEYFVLQFECGWTANLNVHFILLNSWFHQPVYSLDHLSIIWFFWISWFLRSSLLGHKIQFLIVLLRRTQLGNAVQRLLHILNNYGRPILVSTFLKRFIGELIENTFLASLRFVISYILTWPNFRQRAQAALRHRRREYFNLACLLLQKTQIGQPVCLVQKKLI